MLKWPWRKFDAFYEAFRRREIVEILERQKNSIVGGVWGNSNYDKQDDKQIESPRQALLDEIEQWFNDAVRVVYGEIKSPDEDERITKEDEENPFLRPAIMANRNRLKELPEPTGATVSDVVDSDYEVDQ